MMDRDKALEKIKKCLALAASNNEHEAAAAMRQAQALMREFGVCDAELLGVEEQAARAGARRKPSIWESELAAVSASTFGCDIIFGGGAGQWLFIGCDAAPQISRYSFEVLFRQVKSARREYAAKHLRRCKGANKTKRADMFCLGWVRSASAKIARLDRTEQQDNAIALFISAKHPGLKDLKPINRNKAGRVTDDFVSGLISGKDARLNHGVAGDEPLQLESLY